MPYHEDHDVALYLGDTVDVMRTLPDASVDCVVTSPPYYGLRDYGHPGQYGLEATPEEYVARMVTVFGEVHRLLRRDGTCWVNLGDSYAGSTGGGAPSPSSTLRGNGHVGGGPKQQTGAGRPSARRSAAGGRASKNLLGIPWHVAFGLQADGWILRNAVVWAKPNAMPESVCDRLSCRYETVFLLVRSPRYWFDLDAIREPLAKPEALDNTRTFGGRNKGGLGGIGATARRRGNNIYGSKHQPRAGGRATMRHHAGRGRNPGDVWRLPTQPYPRAHFATMPPELARRCVLAGCRPGGTVLDPFSGSGTTGMVARRAARRYIGIDLRADYHRLAIARLGDVPLDFTT